jgi:isopentenyl diphosphate isomerase/L-lactate dehydrogenase-like FMN-dependent dehydrogenase
MSPKDAELACKAGVDAIIVSNHGGRVLDQMPGSMDVLPDIVSVAKDSTIIMIDGGFRDGTDIIKALP